MAKSISKHFFLKNIIQNKCDIVQGCPNTLIFYSLCDIHCVVKSEWVNESVVLNKICTWVRKMPLMFSQASREFSTAASCHDRDEQFSAIALHAHSYSLGITLTDAYIITIATNADTPDINYTVWTNGSDHMQNENVNHQITSDLKTKFYLSMVWTKP